MTPEDIVRLHTEMRQLVLDAHRKTLMADGISAEECHQVLIDFHGKAMLSALLALAYGDLAIALKYLDEAFGQMRELAAAVAPEVNSARARGRLN